MMPQRTRTARVCRDCDGFPVVAITAGTRHTDGTRTTLRITCPTCQGTGHTTPIVGLTRAGR